jgi:hypothetical protein
MRVATAAIGVFPLQNAIALPAPQYETPVFLHRNEENEATDKVSALCDRGLAIR